MRGTRIAAAVTGVTAAIAPVVVELGTPSSASAVSTRVIVSYTLHGAPVATDGHYYWECKSWGCGSGFHVGRKYVTVHLPKGIRFQPGSGWKDFQRYDGPWAGHRLLRRNRYGRLIDASYRGKTSLHYVARPPWCKAASYGSPSGPAGQECWVE